MKTLLLFVTCSAFIIGGCASTKGSKDDYFGYSNSPKIESEEQSAQPIKRKETTTTASKAAVDIPDSDQNSDSHDQDWVNPMSDDQLDNYQDNYSSGGAAVPVGYRYYNAPSYVPVMVPWWDYYSGWMGGYYVRPVIVVRYRNWFWGWNSYCDWYSPFYDYHPCYGGSFGYYNPYYRGGYYPYWRPWNHYPIYTYHTVNPRPRTPNTVRTWGTGTGVSGTALGGKSTAIPSVRNERGQSSPNPATPSQNSSTNSVRTERSTSNSPVGSERAKEGEVRSQRENSNTNVSPNDNVKVTPTPRNESPVRNERTNNDVKPTPRSDAPARKETPSNNVKPAPPREETPVRKERPRSSMDNFRSPSQHSPRVATSARSWGSIGGNSSSARGNSLGSNSNSSSSGSVRSGRRQ